jgi:hypothetical protein
MGGECSTQVRGEECIQTLSHNPEKKSSLWEKLCLLPASRFVLAWLILRTLKVEAICSSETSVHFQRATGRYIPKDKTFQSTDCLLIGILCNATPISKLPNLVTCHANN